MKDISKLTLKEQGNYLMEVNSMFEETSNFWANQMMLKVSELNYLMNKLQEDFSDSLMERANKVQDEIQNLDKKRQFELRELDKFTKIQEDFAKRATHDFNKNLFKSLNSVLNPKKK